MQKFIPTGTVEKAHEALKLAVGGYHLGTLIVGRDDVPQLLRGGEVDIHFVQERGCEVFVGYAGRARPFRSGKAITFRVESRTATVPRKALEGAFAGRRASTRLPPSSPIIDADEEQREAIGCDLIGGFE